MRRVFKECHRDSLRERSVGSLSRNRKWMVALVLVVIHFPSICISLLLFLLCVKRKHNHTMALYPSQPSTTRPRTLMEQLLAKKIENASQQGPGGSKLFRTDSLDSTSSIGSIGSLILGDDVCRCDDCLLGIVDLYKQGPVETALAKKKVSFFFDSQKRSQIICYTCQLFCLCAPLFLLRSRSIDLFASSGCYYSYFFCKSICHFDLLHFVIIVILYTVCNWTL